MAAVVDRYAAEHGAMRESWDLSDLPDWLQAFQTLQAWEAWQERGAWVAPRLDELGADVRGRFEAASLIDDDRAAAARRAGRRGPRPDPRPGRRPGAGAAVGGHGGAR